MKALVIAQHPDALRSLCAAARTSSDEVVAVTFSEAPQGVADRVGVIDVPAGQPIENASDTIIALFDEVSADVVLVESIRQLKVVAGRLASHVGVSAIAGIPVLGEDRATSMYFGGVGTRSLKARGVAIYLVPGSLFADLEASGDNAALPLSWVEPSNPVTLISSTPLEKSGVDLHQADVVVGAGRGFSEEKDLDLARDLCEKINAGLGCSRPLTEGVDWLPTETYIGVSGLMLTPKVYVAAGISGQMQHMVGVNRAGTVFAINKDSNAPIFKQCGYGIVGDVKTVIPALLDLL